MKLLHPQSTKRGSATIVMMVLLSLMLIFVLANLKTLNFLKRELKLIEQHQELRLTGGNQTGNTQPQTAQPSGTQSQAPER
jgi:hypothetical protein